MNSILLLPDHVINQIAAGEVIENPASVVKELIDNAIDAGSTQIDIEIQGGGQLFINVQDNGLGMGPADVAASLIRHATSKIQTIEDLDTLVTRGFRGEALAAIAAVSYMKITTAADGVGTMLIAEGGKIQSIQTCARNQGTSIEVRSLFFNTPARRKFQKSAQSNTAQIVKMIHLLALSEPSIGFSLRSNDHDLLRFHPASQKERIQDVLGADVCRNGLWLNRGEVRGFLGSPEVAKLNRSGQYFFLNRRPISAPLLIKAVREGYGTRIDPGAYPLVVLYLDCSPTDFDVNVHPQKKEVRFRSESTIFRLVKSAIETAYLSPTTNTFPRPFSFTPQEMTRQTPPQREPYPWEGAMYTQETLFQEIAEGRALAVVGSFLVIEKRRSLYLVNLQEAMQVIAREKAPSQYLTIPVEFTLSASDAPYMGEWVSRMNSCGVEARPLGPRMFCVDAIPRWLDQKDIATFFEALKDDIRDGFDHTETIQRFCREKPKSLSLFDAELLWKKGKYPEVMIEEADLERIFLKKLGDMR